MPFLCTRLLFSALGGACMTACRKRMWSACLGGMRLWLPHMPSSMNCLHLDVHTDSGAWRIWLQPFPLSWTDPWTMGFEMLWNCKFGASIAALLPCYHCVVQAQYSRVEPMESESIELDSTPWGYSGGISSIDGMPALSLHIQTDYYWSGLCICYHGLQVFLDPA